MSLKKQRGKREDPVSSGLSPPRAFTPLFRQNLTTLTTEMLTLYSRYTPGCVHGGSVYSATFPIFGITKAHSYKPGIAQTTCKDSPCSKEHVTKK